MMSAEWLEYVDDGQEEASNAPVWATAWQSRQ